MLKLTDVALIHSRSKAAVPQEDENSLSLKVIVQLIGKNKWKEAYTHRDFLLRYFPRTFPIWRIRQDGVKHTRFTTFAQLDEAVKTGEISLSMTEIPEKYRRFFSAFSTRKTVFARNPT